MKFSSEGKLKISNSKSLCPYTPSCSLPFKNFNFVCWQIQRHVIWPILFWVLLELYCVWGSKRLTTAGSPTICVIHLLDLPFSNRHISTPSSFYECVLVCSSSLLVLENIDLRFYHGYVRKYFSWWLCQRLVAESDIWSFHLAIVLLLVEFA